MSCRPASDKQIGYADSLVEYLEKERHSQTDRYRSKVITARGCIGAMSKLIDEMKEIREETQNAT